MGISFKIKSIARALVLCLTLIYMFVIFTVSTGCKSRSVDFEYLGCIQNQCIDDSVLSLKIEKYVNAIVVTVWDSEKKTILRKRAFNYNGRPLTGIYYFPEQPRVEVPNGLILYTSLDKVKEIVKDPGETYVSWNFNNGIHTESKAFYAGDKSPFFVIKYDHMGRPLSIIQINENLKETVNIGDNGYPVGEDKITISNTSKSTKSIYLAPNYHTINPAEYHLIFRHEKDNPKKDTLSGTAMYQFERFFRSLKNKDEIFQSLKLTHGLSRRQVLELLSRVAHPKEMNK